MTLTILLPVHYLKNINNDEQLKPAALNELKNDTTIQRYMKNAYFKTEDGIPYVFYRGTGPSENLTRLDNTKKIANFFTDNYNIAEFFAEDWNTKYVRGYITNIDPSKVKTYDANGSNFDRLN